LVIENDMNFIFCDIKCNSPLTAQAFDVSLVFSAMFKIVHS